MAGFFVPKNRRIHMSEGTTYPITEVAGLVEDPDNPQFFLMAEPAALTEDPDYPQFYLIGS